MYRKQRKERIGVEVKKQEEEMTREGMTGQKTRREEERR